MSTSPARIRRNALTAALALSLALSGCTMFTPAGKPLAAEGRVTAQGLTLELERATVSVPGGSAPEGAVVSAAMDHAGTPPAFQGASSAELQKAAGDAAAGAEARTGSESADEAFLKPLSGVLNVDAPDNLAHGMSISFAAPGKSTAARQELTAAKLAIAYVREEGAAPELIRAALTEGKKGAKISATVTGGGRFWAVYADIPALLDHTAQLMESAGPPAADNCKQEQTVAGTAFAVTATKAVAVCLDERDKLLAIKMTATSLIPMRLATVEQRVGTPLVEEKPTSYFESILLPMLRENHDLAGTSLGQTGSQGTAVEYESVASGVEELNWEIQPYPALFLLKYLASMTQTTMTQAQKTEAAPVDASRTAQCLAPIMRANLEKTSLTEDWSLSFTNEYLACIAGTLEITPVMDVILGAANAASAEVSRAAVELWKNHRVTEQNKLNIAGKLEWKTYRSTLNGVGVSFAHPAAWTVMDGTVNQQFAAANSILVYDHNGSLKARLTVHSGISQPAAQHPLTVVKTTAGKQYDVLTQLLEVDGAFRLGTSVVPKGHEAHARGSAVTLEGGVRLGAQHVSMWHTENFASRELATRFLESADFKAVERMLSEFTG